MNRKSFTRTCIASVLHLCAARPLLLGHEVIWHNIHLGLGLLFANLKLLLATNHLIRLPHEALGRLPLGQDLLHGSLRRQAQLLALAGKQGLDLWRLHDAPPEPPAPGAQVLEPLGLCAEQVVVEAADLVDGPQHPGRDAGPDHLAQRLRVEPPRLHVGPPLAPRLDVVLFRHVVAEPDRRGPVQTLVGLLVRRPRSKRVRGDLEVLGRR
ncbi:uncharacterized protein PgNI_00961 [Pyricularia grisea]|uniref:Uncharacterized protein n=1 Tax=Pyricularia grisea TaxID=148305 RepID=A0A6P8BL91_PYRGI|nr:uncharacterized protein PgNI_00961 [Pyricularia grisea]TLD17568.1 hypothetical protein PgNI_00961 [Pyricularia grisea]